MVQINTPDCDDCYDNVNAFYFTYQKKNEYGVGLDYVEHANCFEGLSLELGDAEDLYLFDVDINENFKNIDREELKKLFDRIHHTIITQLHLRFTWLCKATIQ